MTRLERWARKVAPSLRDPLHRHQAPVPRVGPPAAARTRFARALGYYSRAFDWVCIAATVVFCALRPGLIPLAVLASVAMAANDFVGTALVRAEAIGRGDIAGEADRTDTVMKLAIFSYAAVRLTSGHGALGALGLTPVLLVDLHVTKQTTILVRRMKPAVTEDYAPGGGPPPPAP